MSLQKATFLFLTSKSYTILPVPFSIRLCHGVVTRLGYLSTLGNFLKTLARINLPKSPTFLCNFCKGVKIFKFSSEIILGNFYRHLAIFTGHTGVHTTQCTFLFACQPFYLPNLSVYLSPFFRPLFCLSIFQSEQKQVLRFHCQLTTGATKNNTSIYVSVFLMSIHSLSWPFRCCFSSTATTQNYNAKICKIVIHVISPQSLWT